MSEEAMNYLLIGLVIPTVIFVVLALVNVYSRVRIFRMVSKLYAVSEIDLDSTNYNVAIVKTTDTSRLYNGKGYKITPEAFKLIDGIPVIRHHWSSPEPVFLRGYSAVQFINNYPTSISGTAQVEVDQYLPGQKKPIKGVQEVPISQVKDLEITGWRQEMGEIKKFEPIATPDELGAWIILKDAEAEAKAILLKMQQLDKMWLVILGCVVLMLLNVGITYYVHDEIGKIKATEEGIQANVYGINSMLANMTQPVNSSQNYLPKPIPVPSG